MEIFYQDAQGGNDSALPLDIWITSSVVSQLKRYITPVLCTVGVTANLLGLLAVCRSKLKTYTPGVFMGGILVSDSVFLATLGFIWATSLYPGGLRGSDWCCMVTSFLMQLSGILSLWCTFSLACNRLLMFRKPKLLKSIDYLQNPAMALLIVFMYGFIGISVAMNQSLLLGVLEIGGINMCLPRLAVMEGWAVMSLADLVINFAVVHAGIIICTVYNHHMYRTRQQSSFEHPTSRHLAAETDIEAEPSSDHQSRNDGETEFELTKVSIVFCYTYLLLTLPGHCVRFIASVHDFGPEHFLRVYVWQQLLMYLYIVRSASLWPVSALSSALVRKTVIRTCARRR